MGTFALRPRRAWTRAISVGTVVAGVAASAAVVWHSSYSAFSATTVNPTNNWAAGNIALTDDDSNTAMFTASNIKPTSTGTKCIAVTSNGTLASTVKLYGTTYSTTNALASSLNLTVKEGTGGGFSSCTGFTAGATLFTGTLAGFAAASTNFSNGVGTWAPTGTPPESKTYQFVWTLDPNTPNTAQSGTAAIGFTWEAQNS
jgi:hypothetical protein